MDKECFYRLAQTLQSIKNDLLLNPELRRLLVLDNPDDTNIPTPSLQNTAGYIYTQPIIDVDVDGIFDKSVFITLNMKSSSISNDKNENLIKYTITIMPMVDKNKYVYNNKIRILEIMQAIINIVDFAKYDLASPIKFVSCGQEYTNKDIIGYCMTFVASDGIADKDDDN